MSVTGEAQADIRRGIWALHDMVRSHQSSPLVLREVHKAAEELMGQLGAVSADASNREEALMTKGDR